MGWLAPPTVVTGGFITAAYGNAYIRDNPQWLHDILSAAVAQAIAFKQDADVAGHGLRIYSTTLGHYVDLWIDSGGAGQLDNDLGGIFRLSSAGGTSTLNGGLQLSGGLSVGGGAVFPAVPINVTLGADVDLAANSTTYAGPLATVVAGGVYAWAGSVTIQNQNTSTGITGYVFLVNGGTNRYFYFTINGNTYQQFVMGGIATASATVMGLDVQRLTGGNVPEPFIRVNNQSGNVGSWFDCVRLA